MFELFITENQSMLRMTTFLSLLGLLFILEQIIPRLQFPGLWFYKRQLINLSLLLIDIVLIRLLMPLALFDLANQIHQQGYGLINLVTLPFWLNIIISIVVFDLLIYLQHIAFHKYKYLWRIHQAHHTDTQFNVTTGVRFHPFEIVLSFIYKMLAVVLIGPAAISILLYEILLNAAALFTHSNIAIGKAADNFLRRIIVTPDMHRVHHSNIKNETDSNYGNILSIWDKLFHTYLAQPEAGHEHMRIGLDEFQEEEKT